MQDSREKKRCLIFARNNANDTADRIEAYAKKSGMEVVETIFNTDKKAVERLRYYIERDAIICVLVRDCSMCRLWFTNDKKNYNSR